MKLVDLEMDVTWKRERSVYASNERQPGGVFLPLALIELEPIGTIKHIVTMPEWLAHEKELI